MKRSTPETLMLIFGITLAFVIVAELIGVIVVAIVRPDSDLNLGVLQTQIQILLGAVLGYATGRAIKPPPPDE